MPSKEQTIVPPDQFDAHFKAPHRVTFVNELPKTATDKIQKYIL